MTLTRDDYWAVARALEKLPNTPDKYEAIGSLIAVFAADNPLFDGDLFYDACEQQPREYHHQWYCNGSPCYCTEGWKLYQQELQARPVRRYEESTNDRVR